MLLHRFFKKKYTNFSAETDNLELTSFENPIIITAETESVNPYIELAQENPSRSSTKIVKTVKQQKSHPPSAIIRENLKRNGRK